MKTIDKDTRYFIEIDLNSLKIIHVGFEDKELLEDLLAAAVNDAVRRIEETNKNAMSGLASGMGMPPGFKMPF